MKVIKYGEGYEPKVATCECCKSEIEYFNNELDEFVYMIDKSGQTLYSLEELKDWGVAVTEFDMICPACRCRTTIERQLQPVWKKTPPSNSAFQLLINNIDL